MSSWWDKYLAPGDIRRQNESSSKPAPIERPATAPPDPSQRNTPERRVDAATRARRQNGLLLGGIAFTCLSAFVTRRALAKKKLAAYPKFVKAVPGQGQKIDVPTFAPSNTQPKAEGGLDAAEALFLATLNVASVFMLGTGAFMKYNDIADVEDMRNWVREGVGYDVYAGDSEADKEIEAWMADILSRKDGVGDLKTSIVEKMAELAELDKKKSVSQELAELEKKKKALEARERA
ncbi:hypothetical protein HII31_05059 [Pseudocercospora fuligena]|uniref:Altered inheritance of mitochondria protein 11 n=1 Tax=Pseudocercospora fuligena TaxID=685502 RepID=A0A8H6VNY6_9PEZI|nr:hypothetical protein HII31_05059 [Pseudocercospora fuligena]